MPSLEVTRSNRRNRQDFQNFSWAFIEPGVYIYARGCENKGLIEGIRFGVIIGLFVGVPLSYDWYAILAIPYSLALKWFLSGMLMNIIMGAVVATLYKPESSKEPN